MKSLTLALLVLPLLACSSKGTYEAIQSGQKNQCQGLYGHEYDKCIEQYSKPYEEYERERKEALEQ